MRVSVIGGSTVDEETYESARTLGNRLADRGHTVLCGGLTGVMEATARGVAERGGSTIGILPGADREAANPYVDTVIATGLGNARNVLIALNGDAVVAVDGGPGTLSEIGHALDFGKPIAGLNTHDLPGIEHVETPEEAVQYVETTVEMD
ncbi:putative Rossmann fold nucleotide-binding protein [Halanaeroarchaeum sp. HSR-CO]|uniref:TIGR00725 family protein n=1 Tax=Halanaeroarchaeum sp. HSR-CO TaxID=2866382 RepID=UPI00217EFFEC|nr:TIGR00725 family protein [Halanaeroarchaeum sp. HSR-CO]UWG47650.1 putative Rossmann fold nucleotide-binding protein [Halanaeroarchaeum sp. HSR-CO]